MPARTNEFQTLILNIYKQMSNAGEIVRESVMLNERQNGTPREVDILLETRVFGTNMRIAVECRGRTDKDDITWIDSLVGKYRDLEVNKIVAVSKSGFSEGAQDKATFNRIDILTLEEALEKDWPSEFTKLGIGTITRNDIPKDVSLITEPLLTNPVSFSTVLLTEEGESISTLEEAAFEIYQLRKDNVTEMISSQIPSSFKTLADVQSGFGSIEIPFTLTVPVFVDDGGRRAKVTQIIVNMICTFSFKEYDAQRYVLGDKQITQSVLTDATSNDKFTIRTIQEADKPNQARLHIEKIVVTPPKKSKPRKP